MKKIGIITKRGVPEAVKAVKKLLPLLKKKGFEVFIESEAASVLKMKGCPRQELPSLADMLMVLGGDGTLLNVAGLVGDKEVPILGVNLGGLGFITEITSNEIQDSINKIAAGRYDLEDRIMLSADV
ncbi:MAG: NAD(+)/NADH kinase, partial [Nitrospirae bacterium]|nr:NAD(+)/NADH kinase [Nitrospirota bacterium]